MITFENVWSFISAKGSVAVGRVMPIKWKTVVGLTHRYVTSGNCGRKLGRGYRVVLAVLGLCGRQVIRRRSDT